MGRLTLLCIFCILLSACQHMGGSFCDIAKPERLTPATVDAMTDAEVEKALAHNEKGRRLCGWVQ